TSREVTASPWIVVIVLIASSRVVTWTALSGITCSGDSVLHTRLTQRTNRKLKVCNYLSAVKALLGATSTDHQCGTNEGGSHDHAVRLAACLNHLGRRGFHVIDSHTYRENEKYHRYLKE